MAWMATPAAAAAATVASRTSVIGSDLGYQMCPVWSSGRIDDLVHPPFAIAPDQLATVVDRDDDRNDRKRAGKRLHHQARCGIQVSAVEARHVPQLAAGIQHANADQHKERRALEHERHVKTRQPHELRPTRGAVCTWFRKRDSVACSARPEARRLTARRQRLRLSCALSVLRRVRRSGTARKR